MKKHAEPWSVKKLLKQFNQINFPEYQREPNLWARAEKQRLIDSMIREFDIASLYLYQHNDGAIDCVDGRQRIGAIMAFLGEAHGEADNGFPYRILNEIHDEDTTATKFGGLDGKSFNEIEVMDEVASREFMERFCNYEITVVLLSDSDTALEFNLQFTRLNLGTIINSGEKLNAMAGELRDECFGPNRLGSHPFFREIGIPTRRYAQEQVAAQIVAQIFSVEADDGYARTRHFDLQRLFKEHSVMDQSHKDIISRLADLLDLLDGAFDEDASVLRNRAIVVSTVLLAWEMKIETSAQASRFAEFIQVLQGRLRWQIAKGLDMATEYRYLVGFQRNITQASVEKPAVRQRAQVMQEQYQQWIESEKLQGDEEWEERHPGQSPGVR